MVNQIDHSWIFNCPGNTIQVTLPCAELEEHLHIAKRIPHSRRGSLTQKCLQTNRDDKYISPVHSIDAPIAP